MKYLHQLPKVIFNKLPSPTAQRNFQDLRQVLNVIFSKNYLHQVLKVIFNKNYLQHVLKVICNKNGFHRVLKVISYENDFHQVLKVFPPKITFTNCPKYYFSTKTYIEHYHKGILSCFRAQGAARKGENSAAGN